MKAILIALFLLAGPVLAQTTAPSESWTPTQDMVAKLEAQISAPAMAGDFHTARRFYWGAFNHGHRTLIGQFRMGAGPGAITIVKAGERAPVVMDGGCHYVMVWYDVDADEVIQVSCNGVA